MVLLYLNSDQMGHGEEALGQKLLLTFLDQLAASDVQVDLVGCVNYGVRLTSKDSPALPALRKLEERGARIASCGTCLDHYGIRDALAIGEVGNMSQTVQVMAMADRVIRPC
ncbi:MAG: sulfurtransferase-like selenium metabolism protein YedF [Candidatus Eisenbacteria bacterium]|uniref:Sulfurtransferase-like selenium metabolism protein YedF n=1 Tax=Eiseniibacteriota bacterium TaxID=2212470 RepID=A0A956RPL7_UNCEI|nr:sulfurtransferase-like selenium metabolism protein YedF [Candidatus Eisenbacteria bacterium]